MEHTGNELQDEGRLEGGSEIGPRRRPLRNVLSDETVDKLAGFWVFLGKREDVPPSFSLAIGAFIGIVLVPLVSIGQGWQVAVTGIIAVVAIWATTAYFTDGRSFLEMRSRAKQERDLSSFLGVPGERSQVAFFVPRVKAEHRLPAGVAHEVNSLASADVEAAVEVVCLLAQLDLLRGASTFQPSDLYLDESVVDRYRGNTLFLIGGPLPNFYVREMVERDRHLVLRDENDELTIEVAGIEPRRFSMKPPRGDRGLEDAFHEPTYGCVMKRRREGSGLTKFAIWGLDERGTKGAARWLARHWSRLHEEFGHDDFTAVMRIPARRFSGEMPVKTGHESLLLPS